MDRLGGQVTLRRMDSCDEMSLDYCIRQSVIADVLHLRADCFKFLSSFKVFGHYLDGFEDEGNGNGEPRNGEPRSKFPWSFRELYM